METLEITATDRSPGVHFNFQDGVLKLTGESYPEDVNQFYSPIFDALEGYLKGLGAGACRFEFELIYFNSSSAKAIMMIMDQLEAAAAAGASVNVHWRYDVDDDNMMELGEELGEDLEAATFHLETLNTDG